MAKEIKFEGKELDAGTRAAIANNVLVEGARPITWWRKQSNDLHSKFMREMRTSLENGESTAQAATRITGGTIKGIEVPGIMNTAKNNANTLARTAINKVTNEARIQSFEANDDIIKAMKQISTLDSRTSQICIAYDGQVWVNAPGKDNHLEPVPPSTLPFNGGPPRHFNCRSTLVPVLKSWEELGIPADELKPSTRASMDGQVPADTTFDDFLKGKTESFQNDILGPTKAKLWRQGKITLQQLVNFRGNPLTTEQLVDIATKRRGLPAPPPGVVAPAVAPAAPPPVAVEGEPRTADRWQKASWNDSPKYVTDTVNAAPPLKKVTSDADGSYFMPGQRHVNMDPQFPPKSLRGQGTWRHEYGHHLDREFSEQLSDASKKASRRHISASPTLKKAFGQDTRSVNKGAGGKTPTAAFENTNDVFQKHLKKAMDGGTAYLDGQLKKFGLSYKEMRDLHRKHMDDSVESANDVIMRNKMAQLLAAVETGNAKYYIDAVWERAQYFSSGITGKIADYYGSITQNRVGYGHSSGYYKAGIHKRTTEAFANAVTLIGAERGWSKVIRALGHDKFYNKVDDLLKNGGKL